MKKTLLFLFCVLPTLCCVKAQNVNIPDPNFKNFLINHTYSTNPMGAGITIYLDSNHDGEIQYSEAETYPSDIYNHAFFLQGQNISDLTGVEAFDSIEQLNVTDNPLTALDISGCQSLKSLNATYNNLFTDLTLVSSSLEKLNITCPTLTSLDLSACPALKNISCSNNPIITSLNIDGCAALLELQTYQNPLLTTLNMGSHYNMTHFQVQSNHLTDVDLSSCHSLEYLYLTGNPLTSLNLANGNPQSFTQIIASGFPELTCIKVNNVAVSEFLWTQTGGYYEFDEWATFSTTCEPPAPCVVTIPDPNFKTKLLSISAINTNGNSEIECAEAEAYAGPLNVDAADISDMTGILAFKNITSLSCNDNNWNLTTLDVSGLTSLTTITCNNNILFTTLDASGCTALTSVDVASFIDLSFDLNGCTSLTSLNLSHKNLTFLDISNCSALTSLICDTNTLTTLNLEGCAALQTLDCSNNSITSLAVNNSLLLTDLNCSFNELGLLNVIENTNLTTLNCSNNELTYLLVSNNTALSQLDCSHNNISYLDVNNNLDLTGLNCSHNNLNAINVSANVSLLTYNCSNNNLSVQNVNSNTSLLFFDCSNNNVSSIDVSLNTVLASFYCDFNNLTTVNVSNNGALKYFSCSNNLLPNIDLSGTPALLSFNCSNNLLTALDLSATPQLTTLDCRANQLTALDLSSTHCLFIRCDDNQLESLNVANGYNINTFVLTGTINPSLNCVQVDDAEFSTENWTGVDFAFDSGVSFNENCALGTEQVPNSKFRVYPNPTPNVIYFTKQAHIQVYGITGQLLADKKNVDSLDLSNQPSGFYILTFKNERGQILQESKIVKN